MNITRKNFLRLTSATTMAAAIEAAVTACGGGGGGSTSSSASASTGTTPTDPAIPGVSNASSGTGDGTTITPPTSPPATPSVATPTSTMYWSDPATWAGPGVPNGYVPGPNDTIYITSAQTVYLDADAVCGTLTIFGTLSTLPAPNRNVNLTTGNINVMGSGTLQIGTESAPFPSTYTATITLTGAEVGRVTRTVLGTNIGFSNSGEGRSIRVEAGGKLSLIGQVTSVKRTKLNSVTGPSYAPGTSTFALSDAVNWKAGDEIVIGTTDFYGISAPEKLVLSSNASGNSISTTTGIASARWAVKQYVTDSGMSLSSNGTLTNAPAGTPTELDERAFVIHITRNIVVQGANDTAWTSRKFGAHCMFMGITSSIKLDGVQFRRVGQAGALGRYPIHWHMMSFNMPSGMNAISDGSFLGGVVGHYAKNCSISDSSQRMITIHGTHGVTLDSNVGFDITGHAIFLEDGSEQNNTITNNVVMKVRAPTSTNKLQLHDISAIAYTTSYVGANEVQFTGGSTGIWFTNPRNTLTGNWVNDCAGTGIWNSFAHQCFGLSSNVATSPINTTILNWADNFVCGCQGTGAQTNNIVIDDKGTTVTDTYLASFFSNPITRLYSFKNSAGGYSNRVYEAKYLNWTLADNVSQDIFGQAQSDKSIAQGHLVIAESLNNATSRAINSRRAAFASYHELLNFPNTLAVGYQYQPPLYDGSYFYIGGGLIRLNDLYTQPLFTFWGNTGIKQINGNATFRAKSPSIDGQPLLSGSGPQYRNFALAGAIRDLNGLFVPVGKHWIYDDPFFTTGTTGGTDVYFAGSNGKYVNERFFGVDNFIHTFSNNLFMAPMTVLRQDTSGSTLGQWVIGDGATAIGLGNMRHFAAMNGARYKLTLPNTPVANTVYAFNIQSQDSGNDIFMLGLEWSGSVPAKVYERAQQLAFTGIIPAAPTAGDISAGIARILTSTGSLANVQQDTTGTLFFQDTVNNMVWFQVKVGSLALAYGAGYGNTVNASTVYKQVAIAITA